MPSARLPCSAIFSRLPVSIATISSTSARLSSSSAAKAGAAASFSSSSNSTDSPAKLLTKLSGFLISWAMPAVSWPSEAIFSAWIRLACAAFSSWYAAAIVRLLFRRVARRADLGFAALALGDVGIDQHEAAATAPGCGGPRSPGRPAGCARSVVFAGRLGDAAKLGLRIDARRTRRARRDSGCNRA